MLFGWMGIEGGGGITVFCVLYSFFSAGPITSAAKAVVASVHNPDMWQFGARFTIHHLMSRIMISAKISTNQASEQS